MPGAKIITYLPVNSFGLICCTTCPDSSSVTDISTFEGVLFVPLNVNIPFNKVNGSTIEFSKSIL